MAVLPSSDGLTMLQAFSLANGGEDVLFLMPAIRRNEAKNRLTDHFVRRIAESPSVRLLGLVVTNTHTHTQNFRVSLTMALSEDVTDGCQMGISQLLLLSLVRVPRHLGRPLICAIDSDVDTFIDICRSEYALCMS